MELDTNPYRCLIANITPTDFEEFSQATLNAYAASEGLSDFSILHNEKIITHDGEYQIDNFAEFTALGVRIKILIECKKYKRAIERDEVIILKSKLDSSGSHKGIMISTSAFQTGAVKYAKAHGIALIQIIEESVLHITASLYQDNPIMARMKQEFRNRLPKYSSMLWDYEYDMPFKTIYPTEEMKEKARNEVKELFHA